MVCTEPSPNERVPICVARLCSCNAPATISDAEAEPPLHPTPKSSDQANRRLSVRSALADRLGEQIRQITIALASPGSALADCAENQFQSDASGRSPWWTCPGEKTERIFVVMPAIKANIAV